MICNGECEFGTRELMLCTVVLLQIVVVGPWPYALVHQLYFCVKTLAEDLLALKVKSRQVLCPRCRQTKYELHEARADARNSKSLCCLDSKCKGNMGETAVQEEGGDTQEATSEESDSEEADSEESEADSATKGKHKEERGTHDMATLGCASWIMGLGKKAVKKRRKVVRSTIKAVMESIAATGGATDPTLTIRKAHASRILER